MPKTRARTFSGLLLTAAAAHTLTLTACGSDGSDSGSSEEFSGTGVGVADDHFGYSDVEGYSGTPPATSPQDADIWTAQAEGQGTVTLEFEADEQEGERVVVAMASPDTSPETSLGQVSVASHGEAGHVGTIAIALIVGGSAITILGIVMIIRPFRKARQARSAGKV